LYSSQLVKQLDINHKETHQFIRKSKSKLDDAAFIVDYCSVMHRTEILDSVYCKYENFWDDNSDHWNHTNVIF